MFGGIDPRKMQAMMKQMGIKQDEIEASRVVIERADGGKIIIENPAVTKIDMKGQESWQITGEAHEEIAEGVTDEDVRLVMEKTGKKYFFLCDIAKVFVQFRRLVLWRQFHCWHTLPKLKRYPDESL